MTGVDQPVVTITEVRGRGVQEVDDKTVVEGDDVGEPKGV